MERSLKLKKAYDAGVEMTKATGVKDEFKKAVHVFNPTIHQVLDGVIVAYDEGIKCVIVHPELKFREYDPQEDQKSSKHLWNTQLHREEQDGYK